MSKKRSGWKKTKYKKVGLCAVCISAVALLILAVFLILTQTKGQQKEERKGKAEQLLSKLNLNVKLIENNPYSRPGLPLKKVRGIVVHYTANPGTDAISNRNYFNNLPKLNEKKEKKTYASSHFVIGIDGQIVQCIPTGEMSYASNDRNSDTISIECCHKRKNGRFTDATYQSLLALTEYLCVRFGLQSDDVIRHYDVTGKNCPRYFVEHPEAWNRFLSDVKRRIQ